MTPLWIAVGIVTLVVVAVLAMALLRRRQSDATRLDYDLAVYKDQLKELERDLARGAISDTEAEAGRAEIERRILAIADAAEAEAAPTDAPGRRRVTAAVVALAVPGLSFALYLHLGSPEYPNVPHAKRNLAAETQARREREQATEMASLAAKLAQRLQEEPGNIKGWLLLGRTYLTLEREADAITALRRAAELAPEDADVAVELGEALVLINDNQVPPDARKLFLRALSKDARRPRARYYMALAEAQAGNLKAALQGWVDLLAVSPPGAPWRATVEASIARAAKELNVDPKSVEPTLAAKLLGPPKAPVPAPETETAGAAPAPSQSPGPTREQMQAAQEMSAGDRAEMIRGMVQRLADRLKDNPDDLAGWQRLAGAYRVLGDSAKAEEAERQIQRLGQSAPAPAPSQAPTPIPTPTPGPTREKVEAAQGMSAGDRAEMIRGMVQRLADRLKDNPDDLAGWQRLARAYRVLGETEKAEAAEKQIQRLSR